jgi:anti-sigma regulatory factor (Ser/Thr protein kinase)
VQDARVELQLSDGPAAASATRRAVAAALDQWGLSELTDDAVLAVSELVTNAILHADPPFVVRLARGEGGVRLEVEDGSRTAPVRPLASTETMTGRGISLVDAVAQRWGVDQLPDGKVVWCELRPPSADVPQRLEDDLDVLLAAWDDDHDAAPTFTVELGDVPSSPLLRAERPRVTAEPSRRSWLSSSTRWSTGSPRPGRPSSDRPSPRPTAARRAPT